MNIVATPLSTTELRAQTIDEDTVELEVLVTLEEVMASTEEDFGQLLATKATGSAEGLREIDYMVSGAHQGQILIWVEAIVDFDRLEALSV